MGNINCCQCTDAPNEDHTIVQESRSFVDESNKNADSRNIEGVQEYESSYFFVPAVNPNGRDEH